jgi:hypothetical protein
VISQLIVDLQQQKEPMWANTRKQFCTGEPFYAARSNFADFIEFNLQDETG